MREVSALAKATPRGYHCESVDGEPQRIGTVYHTLLNIDNIQYTV